MAKKSFVIGFLVTKFLDKIKLGSKQKMILKFAKRLNIFKYYCWNFEIFRFGHTKLQFFKENIILVRFAKKSGQHGTLKCFGFYFFSLFRTTYLKLSTHYIY
jgi:hypothetical protein